MVPRADCSAGQSCGSVTSYHLLGDRSSVTPERRRRWNWRPAHIGLLDKQRHLCNDTTPSSVCHVPLSVHGPRPNGRGGLAPPWAAIRVVEARVSRLDHPFDHPDDPTGPYWIRLHRRPVQREQTRSVWSRPDRRRAPGYGSGGGGSNPSWRAKCAEAIKQEKLLETDLA